MTVVSGTVIADERIETFTFEDIHSIDIETISGSIRICPGDESRFIVELINDLEEPELLDPELEVDDGELFIEENFIGNNVRGETYWTVYLPKSASLRSIECNSASGDISFEEFEAKFIETESASGKISVNSVGTKELVLSNASGKIFVEDAEIDKEGEMSSASGEVKLYLPHLPSKRLEASSASGDVVLKVPPFGKNFSMTLMKRADKGKIKCPFEYTEKETIRLHKNDRYLTDRYLVKRGKGGPDIKLRTASGTIKIETNTKGK